MAKASELLGDRWSLLILREAFYGVVRFADMQADIGVPRSILTGRLAKLVEAGLLERFDYKEDGARARQAYRLTERGRGLAVVLLAMKQWWDEGDPDGASVSFVPDGGEEPVRIAMVDAFGREVRLGDIRLRVDPPPG
ncbi:MAG: winged helix-turn-helix transcriptional regulator [Pseudodonghicola sp.]|jgi:DNA-binding HxlR family transcriptional regulator|uniref:winged helix-turn-helix transcriptional regulator n=1 Tax=Pseudodonghicola sp. TaxID=1969463 RepID=UPI003A980CE2